mmetsp:Transcript_15556/g.39153  ORF Transcript_15556/g.39153 Transcript_15556/m.39153 type:complete len:463 (+) Transcript_15556:1522-2910(+)
MHVGGLQKSSTGIRVRTVDIDSHISGKLVEILVLVQSVLISNIDRTSEVEVTASLRGSSNVVGSSNGRRRTSGEIFARELLTRLKVIGLVTTSTKVSESNDLRAAFAVLVKNKLGFRTSRKLDIDNANRSRRRRRSRTRRRGWGRSWWRIRRVHPSELDFISSRTVLGDSSDGVGCVSRDVNTVTFFLASVNIGCLGVVETFTRSKHKFGRINVFGKITDFFFAGDGFDFLEEEFVNSLVFASVVTDLEAVRNFLATVVSVSCTTAVSVRLESTVVTEQRKLSSTIATCVDCESLCHSTSWDRDGNSEGVRNTAGNPDCVEDNFVVLLNSTSGENFSWVDGIGDSVSRNERVWSTIGTSSVGNESRRACFSGVNESKRSNTLGTLADRSTFFRDKFTTNFSTVHNSSTVQATVDAALSSRERRRNTGWLRGRFGGWFSRRFRRRIGGWFRGRSRRRFSRWSI